jgi:hypothetical protein
LNWNKPGRDEVNKAINAYVAIAYGGLPLPKAVRQRVDALATAVDDDGLYDLAIFEVDKAQPVTRYAIRLGNRSYPHMKLVIESAPDGRSHLFRADTHDQHVRPQPGTRDAEAFTRLMGENQLIAEQIELAWEQAGLPTFKTYLRQDLARRAAAAGATAGGAPNQA